MSYQQKNSLAFFILFLSVIVFAQKIPEKQLNVTQMKSKGFADAPKKVFIKNFKIYYQMIAEAEKTSYGGRQIGGGSYTGNATARLAVGVEGIAPDDLQKLTNQIYSDYINSLEATGLEIFNSSDFPNLAFFAEDQLLEGPRINQEQIKGSLMVVPEGFSYYVKKVNKKGKEKGSFMTNMGGPYAQFTTAIYHAGLPQVSKALEDMIVVDISINVPSIYLDPKSRLGTVKIKGGAYLRIENARVTYVSGKMKKPGAPTPDKAIEITLSKAVPIPEVFGSQDFKTQASKQRTSTPGYASFFSVQDTNVELSNTIKCEASVYQEEVGKAVGEFLDISIKKLALGMSGEKVK